MADPLSDGMTVDVLIVGSGGGIAGAYTAAREGCSVALVEATNQFGGTTAYSGGGGVWFPCNPVLQRAGCNDTLEEAFGYFHQVVGDRTPRALQETYVSGGAALIEYLERDEHFSFKVLPWPDYFGLVPGARADGMRHIVFKAIPDVRLGRFAGCVRGPLDRERHGDPAPDLLVGGRALIGRFLSALAEYPNVSLALNAELTDLVIEGGAVVGAVVTQGESSLTIRARCGVLLAAGGFEQDDAMRAHYGVPGTAFDSMGAPANTGRAHRAAIAAGARTDLMDQAWWAPGLIHPDGRATFALWFDGGMFVNQVGSRFVNEAAPYDRVGRDAIRQIQSGTLDLPFWMIYDDRDGGVPPVKATNVTLPTPAEFREAELWQSADTLEELAALIGLPTGRLVEAVRRFNGQARRGFDEDFSRGMEPFDRAFSGGASPLVPITTPPFHAAAFGLSDLGTKGGLCTDVFGRVLSAASGDPIAGLYAAGNTMAAVSGTTYPGGGIPIGASVLFSHRAALHMSQRPQKP